MHVALFTVIISTGISHGQGPSGYDQYPSSAQQHGESDGADEGYGGVYSPDATFGRGGLRASFGPMPQACYEPRYGCYSGNARYTHRYPAFHGWFYRRPYNYRQYYDHPWHAELHEPTSLFSYDVSEESVRRTPTTSQHTGAPPVDPGPIGPQRIRPLPEGVLPQAPVEEPVYPPSALRRTPARPVGVTSPGVRRRNRFGGRTPVGRSPAPHSVPITSSPRSAGPALKPAVKG